LCLFNVSTLCYIICYDYNLSRVTQDLLLSEIDQVPEPFLDEVLDFVHYLKTKIIKERTDTITSSYIELAI
jgi:hypothetical protein